MNYSAALQTNDSRQIKSIFSSVTEKKKCGMCSYISKIKGQSEVCFVVWYQKTMIVYLIHTLLL